MKPAPFIRHAPKTLDEALTILGRVAPQDGRILAGGQSLVPIMAFRLAKPAHLVDINEVAGLDRLDSDGQTLTIGARVRHAAFHVPVIDNPLGSYLQPGYRDALADKIELTDEHDRPVPLPDSNCLIVIERR